MEFVSDVRLLQGYADKVLCADSEVRPQLPKHFESREVDREVSFQLSPKYIF